MLKSMRCHQLVRSSVAHTHTRSYVPSSIKARTSKGFYLPCHVETPSAQKGQHRHRFSPLGAVGQGYNSGETAHRALESELKALEAERDDSIKTGEACARAVTRLSDMVAVLDKIALEKVKQGYEDSAKEILKEKASIRSILDKAKNRAEINFALAGRLAQKIGLKQSELLRMAAPPGSTAGDPPAWVASDYSSRGSGTSTTSSSFSSSTTSASSDFARESVPAWQKSLEEAHTRLASQQVDVEEQVIRARVKAEGSIEAARQRMASQKAESVLEAQARLRMSAEESIAEAQARLRAADAVALAAVERTLGRYRRGEYVSDSELEVIFRELGRLRAR